MKMVKDRQQSKQFTTNMLDMVSEAAAMDIFHL